MCNLTLNSRDVLCRRGVVELEFEHPGPLNGHIILMEYNFMKVHVANLRLLTGYLLYILYKVIHIDLLHKFQWNSLTVILHQNYSTFVHLHLTFTILYNLQHFIKLLELELSKTRKTNRKLLHLISLNDLYLSRPKIFIEILPFHSINFEFM